jgi:predicted nucleotidyltransferase/DNA-binding transcriptional ArsR family regulator
VCPVTRLIASEHAPRALLLLSQHGSGRRVSEVARGIGISYTGAEKALRILVADGLVDRSERGYVPVDSLRTREAIRFAYAFLPVDAALAALTRGNEVVEFAGVDDQGALIVLRRFAEPASEARLREAVIRLQQLSPGIDIELVTKECLREQLLDDLSPRRRAAGMRILKGDIDRSFPDRSRHGDLDAKPLGRLNEGLRVPSGRSLSALAREYGLRRILAFGSATRADLRPDSDLDLLVELASGRHLSLTKRVGLNADADQLFGRDVDLLVAPVRRSSLAERIDRDGVVLYDAAR